MSHIEVIALRPFLWSDNGYTQINAVEKQEFDLPERLFDGLNAAGYVRRAVIGDGHFELNAGGNKTAAMVAPDAERSSAPTGEVTAEGAGEEPAEEASEGTATGAGGAVSTEAEPKAWPAEGLTAEEEAALSDGTWEDWKFFKSRSVANKIAGRKIETADEIEATLKAYAATKAKV